MFIDMMTERVLSISIDLACAYGKIDRRVVHLRRRPRRALTSRCRRCCDRGPCARQRRASSPSTSAAITSASSSSYIRMSSDVFAEPMSETSLAFRPVGPMKISGSAARGVSGSQLFVVVGPASTSASSSGSASAVGGVGPGAAGLDELLHATPTPAVVTRTSAAKTPSRTFMASAPPHRRVGRRRSLGVRRTHRIGGRGRDRAHGGRRGASEPGRLLDDLIRLLELRRESLVLDDEDVLVVRVVRARGEVERAEHHRLAVDDEDLVVHEVRRAVRPATQRDVRSAERGERLVRAAACAGVLEHAADLDARLSARDDRAVMSGDVNENAST